MNRNSLKDAIAGQEGSVPIPSAERLAAMMRGYQHLASKVFRESFPEYPGEKIRSHEGALDFFLEYASGIEAGTDETAQQAQPERQEPARTPTHTADLYAALDDLSNAIDHAVEYLASVRRAAKDTLDQVRGER